MKLKQHLKWMRVEYNNYNNRATSGNNRYAIIQHKKIHTYPTLGNNQRLMRADIKFSPASNLRSILSNIQETTFVQKLIRLHLVLVLWVVSFVPDIQSPTWYKKGKMKVSSMTNITYIYKHMFIKLYHPPWRYVEMSIMMNINSSNYTVSI